VISYLVQLSNDILHSENKNSGAPSVLLSWFSINMLADRAVRAKNSKRRRWEEY
jgi:hypothetical protein